MNYDINSINVSIDEVHLSSDTRCKLDFEDSTIPGYDSLKLLPLTKSAKLKRTRESQTYEVCFRYEHKETGNHLHVFKGRKKGKRYIPTMALVFYSSYEQPLSYAEVTDALNALTTKLNCGWNLSEFHVAMDHYSEENYLYPLVHSVISRKSRGPKLIGSGTYHFHSPNSLFMLKAYNKRRQLLRDKLDTLSRRSIRIIESTNITRFEAQFVTSGEVSKSHDLPPDLPGLAAMDLSFIVPKYLRFVEPRADLLAARGLGEDYPWPGVAAFRDFLKEHGAKGHYTRYLKDDQLNGPLKKALREYRWCREPDQYPIQKPKPNFTVDSVSVDWKW